MAGVNKVILVGNVGKKPELRTTNSGTAVCEFSLATSESWKDKSGEKQERTEWHRVLCWAKQAEVMAKYLDKGSKVYVEGRLQTEKYTDKNGVEKYTTKIVVSEFQFLGGKGKGDSPVAEEPAPQRTTVDDGDDVPF